MVFDTVISGRVWRNGKFEDNDIGILDGKIKEIKPSISALSKIDYGGCIIVPAGIDMHVHFRDPGYREKETIYTGSMSAVYGGIGTYFDMPNTRPATSSADACIEKLATMKKNSFSNYGIYGYTDNINNIKNLINHVIGFKIFMAHTTGGLVLDDSIDLPDLIRNLDLTGKITVFHAEEPKYFLKEQADNLVKYSKIRNCKSEAEAIKRVINVNAKNIHIAHLSCPDNLQYVYGKSFEVTPHHILLNNELPLNTYGKVNPPIRSEKDRLNLFNAFKEGIVPIMASDHAPHLENEKIVSFENAPAGIPGVETMYPLMLYLSKKGLLNISNVIRSLSENPAKLFNLQKGVIASNMDADLAIFDMDKVTNIKGNRLHSKAGWTPYEGFSAIFPKDVYIGGIRVIKEYELNSDPAGRSVVETKKHSNFIN